MRNKVVPVRGELTGFQMWWSEAAQPCLSSSSQDCPESNRTSSWYASLFDNKQNDFDSLSYYDLDREDLGPS